MLNTVNLATANPLSVNFDWKNKSGLLSLGHSNDVYSLAVSKASSLNLNLSTIGAGNLFAIVRDGNGNNKIEDGEILFQSSQTSVIQNVQLAAGNYSIVADLTTLTGGATSVMYQFGLSYASQSKILWRDLSNNQQVGFWDFTMTANGPQMTATQLTFSGVDDKWVVEATGDLNGDGVTDILWRHKETNGVVFWEMDDQGNILRTTPSSSVLTVPADWKVIGMGDMDGDGKDDILWRNPTTNQTVVWRMDGQTLVSGDFLIDMDGQSKTLAATWKLEQTADWNGDGRSDLFWRDINSGEIQIWLMNGKQVQSSFSLGSVTVNQGWQIEGLGDIDANGTTDILWRQRATGNVVVWTMNSDGKLLDSRLYGDILQYPNWQVVGVSDFTGDGKADVAWRDTATGKFVLWQMEGLNLQQRSEVQSGDFTLARQAVAVGQKKVVPEFDVKLPEGGILWRDTNTNQIGIWNFSNSPLGAQLNSTQLLWNGNAVTIDWKIEAVGDFNGDRLTDILWRNSTSNAVTIWELDGQGNVNLLPISTLTNVPQDWQVVGVADLDGDSRDDIIWQHSSANIAVVWRMDGRQMIAGEYITDLLGNTINITSSLKIEKSMDWNGDGKADLLLRNSVTNQVSVWLMNGKLRQSVLDLNADLNMGLDWKLEGVEEMTGDRKVDILWRNQSTGAVSVWQMVDGKVVQQKALNGMPTGNWDFVGMADFNGDGKTDVVWRNKQDAQKVTIWEMDGTGIKQQYDRSSAEFSGSRKAFGAVQSTMTSVPLTVNLTADSDTGISSADGITKIKMPKVTGVAMPGAIVTLYANTTIVGTTTVGVNGNWEITSQKLADGAYDLSAEIWTVQGQVIHQKIKSVTIDTQISTPAGMKLTPVSDTGMSSNDGITSQTKPTITGTTEALAVVTIKEGTTILGTTTADTTGIWQFVPTTALTTGLHNLTATALDIAGNVSVLSIPLSVQIDTIAPTLSLTTNFVNATINETSRLTGNLSDLGIGTALLKYHFGTNTDISVSVGDDGKFDQLINLNNVSTGAAILTITGIDVAGNTSTTTYNVMISDDIQVPIITASLDTTTVSSPKLIGQVTDDRGIQFFKARLGNQTQFTNIIINPANGSYSIDITQLNGAPLTLATSYTIYIQAQDTSNNLSPLQSNQIYLVDPAKPIDLSLSDSNGTSSVGQIQLPAPNDPNGPRDSITNLPYTGPILIQQNPDGAVHIDLGKAVCKGFSYTPNLPQPPYSSQRPSNRYDYKLYYMDGGTPTAIGAGNFENGQLIIKPFSGNGNSGGIGGGIRTGDYLLAPDFVPVKPLSEIDANPDENCVGCRSRKQFNSDASVELHSGGVLKSEDLVSYQSKGEVHSFALSYSSLQADARPIVHFGYDDIGSNIKSTYRMTGLLTVKVPTGDVTSNGYTSDLNIKGATIGENYWKIPPTGGSLQGAMQIDMRGQASGIYDYDLKTGIKVLCDCMELVGEDTTLHDKLVVVNGTDSDFGTGWGLTGLQRIYETQTHSSSGQLEYNALLVDGDGSYIVFHSLDGVNFATSNGDFSVLTKQSGQFSRMTKDGTAYIFNTDNKLTSKTDRNGQKTQIVYDTSSKQLVKIIDSANLETKFTYNITTGKVDTISDPAGRTTKLNYDSYSVTVNGNAQTQYRLKNIQNPDAYLRSFGYTAAANQALLTSDKDKMGWVSTIAYDNLTGRAKQAIDKDNAVTNVSPAQIVGVVAVEDTKNPSGKTLPIALTPELGQDLFKQKMDQLAFANYTDSAQNAGQHTGDSKIYLNRAQEEFYTKDEFGTSSTVERNNHTLQGQYLVSKVTDARGQKISYSYDARGNVIQVSDSLANNTTAPGTFFPDIYHPDNRDIAIDWNNDGKVDFISNSIDIVTVSYGEGKGLFSAPIKLTNSSTKFTVGDLNKDNSLDLVTTDSTGKIQVYLSNPIDHTLQTPQEFLVPQGINVSAATHLVLADLDGDNAPEIVAMGLGYNNDKWQMTLKNNGLGVFTNPTPGMRLNPLGLATDNNQSDTAESSSIAVGDINGDGKQDLVVVATQRDSLTTNSNSTIFTLLGKADGSFSVLPTIGLASSSFSTVSLGHLSSSTTSDLLIGTGNSLSIYTGTAQGVFSPTPTVQTLTGNLFKGSLKDINGDGVLDTVTQGFNSTVGNQFSIQYGAIGGTFAADQTYATGFNSMSPLAWGDLDGNQQLDLLLTTSNGISSLQQKTDHSFVVQPNADAPKVNSTALSFGNLAIRTIVGDVSGDRVPDLIALTNTGLSIRMGYGDGNYADAVAITLPGTNQAIAVGDLNNDGSQDVVVANTTGGLTVLMSDGRGKFGIPLSIASTIGGNPTVLGLQDVNGDGILDLIGSSGTNNTVSVLFGNGAGGFLTGNNYTVGSNPRAIAIGDLNGDGKLDIATANADSNSVSVLLNNGAGGFTLSTTTYSLASTPLSIAIGDVTGDGRNDLVVGTNAITDNLQVFQGQLGAVPQVLSQKYTFGNLSPWFSETVTALSLADMNGDGKLDVVALTSNSQVYVQLGGSPTLSATQRYQMNGYRNPGTLALADLDLHGAIDIVTTQQGIGASTTDAIVSLNDRLRIALPAAQGKRVTEYDTKFDPAIGQFVGVYSHSFSQVTREVDELGRQTIYQLDDATGRVLRKIQVIGTIDSAAQLTDRTGDDLVTEYSYTSDGGIFEARDPLNHVTRYEYTVDALNVGGNLRRVTYAFGTIDAATESYEYDAAGNQTAAIDEYGNRTTSTYKAGTNLLATMTGSDPDGAGPLLAPVTSYTYDANGNQLTVTEPDPDGVGPPTGAVTTNHYDKLNRLDQTTGADPDGAGPLQAGVTRYEYDFNGNQKAIVDTLGRRSESITDSRNRLIGTVRKNSAGTVLNQSQSLYSPIDQATGTIDANGRRSNTVYDQRGRRIREIDALGNITRFIYDAANQMIAQVDAKGNMTRYTYDDLGRQIEVIDANGGRSQTIYDKNGQVMAQIDANGNRTEFRYDNRGRKIRTYDANNTLSATPEASRKFTEMQYGQVTIAGKSYSQTKVIDPNLNTTTYVYDGLGRLWTDTNQFGKTRTYKYDTAGNQIEIIDRNGNDRTFVYDNLNRQTQENWVVAGTIARSFTSQYDVLNRLIDVTDQSITAGVGTKLSEYAYSYDDLDRLKSIDNLGIGGVAPVKLAYNYDAIGNLKSVTDMISGTLTGTTAYDYDALNRATQITQSGIGITNKRVNLAYNAVGQMTTMTRSAGTSYSPVATSSYRYDDPLNRLTQISHVNAAGGVLGNYTFNYDNGSRIKQIQNADGTFVKYDYANNNELKQADYSPTTRTDENYTYDANGNRTNTGYVTGGNNQLTSDVKYDYTYDNEGNLKTRRDRSTNITRTFTWDYRNRLVGVIEGGVSIAAYSYDAGNQRISKTTGGITTRYVYDRSNVALEFNGAASTPTIRYFYGLGTDQILAQEKGTSNVSWQLTDQLGSVRALVGNDGVLRNQYEYDAFGTVVSTLTGATDDSRYRYTGREFDTETGLNYYRARYFDSNSGRFIGQDPIGFQAGDSNLYRYVGNNPSNLLDPSGLRSETSTEGDIFNRMVVLSNASGSNYADRISLTIRNLKAAISAVPNGEQGSPSLTATLWALKIWAYNPEEYSWKNYLSGRDQVRDLWPSSQKCNRFVGDAYAFGAYIGYGLDGSNESYPIGESSWKGLGYPRGADDLSSNQYIPNFPIVRNPQVGDIVSFPAKGREDAHTGLLLGNGLYISASGGNRPGGNLQVEAGVQIKLLPSLDKRTRVYRTYDGSY